MHYSTSHRVLNFGPPLTTHLISSAPPYNHRFLAADAQPQRRLFPVFCAVGNKMRLSRLRRLLPSQAGFFPDVSSSGRDAMKCALNWKLSVLRFGYEQVPTKPFPFLKLQQHLWSRFEMDKPKYPKTINNAFTLVKGNAQGMLLEAHTVLSIFPPHLRLHLSKSKYIMVSSFLVPLLHDSNDGKNTNHLISVTSELRDLYGSDFEMVLVAKMRHGWLNHKPSFDHFFSGFPPFCRIIPFSHVNTRDHISQLLGLEGSDPMFLLLERSSESTPTYTVLNHCYIDYIFERQGADLFPFTEEVSTAKNGQEFTQDPFQFDEILGRKPCDIHVSKFPPSSGSESVPLSELEGKVVGFYLFIDGSLMLKLDQVSRECRERGLEFEVVVVYMPFHYLCNTNTLMESINDVLYKLPNTRSWWVMHYIDSVSRRLWRLIPSCTYWGEEDDRLLIVGPNGKYFDPYAAAFLGKYGVDVYPFTCERLIEWKLEKVRSVTLESLLVHGSRDFVLGKDINGGLERVPVKQLHGRVILVCFGCGWTKDTRMAKHRLLARYYDEIKSAHPSFEAVSVSLKPNEKLDNVDVSQLPPWLVCPPQPDHYDYVYKTLRIGCPIIVAFGEDGRVRSFRADSLLMCMGVDAFPFDGSDLRQDVIRALASDNDSWTIPELGY